MGLPLFQDPVQLAAVGGAVGLCVGSFLNVVVYRLPRGESVVSPGSRCPRCGRPIRPWQNVPVVSWLVLRGRCAHCREAISLRYPAVELVTGIVFAAIAWHFGARPTTPVWMVFAAALLAAALIDWDHRIIPDEISLGGLVAGVAVVPALRALEGTPYGSALASSAAGALVGGGMLWVVGFAHARISAATGRRFAHWPGEGQALPQPRSLDYWVWFPGMGFGDIKLLAMIGAFLGPLGVLTTIVAASLLGLAVGGIWALATRSWAQPFGFGPAIAVGAVLALFVPSGFWV